MKPLCEIICPERVQDLNKFCNEEEVRIRYCYGYFTNKSCPRTCTYSRWVSRTNDEINS